MKLLLLDLTSSPTRTGTAVEVIMGTAGYMSPEQARGKPVDKRTDIWAFGCVLYEALTSGQVFGGETVTDILAAVVGAEPDWERLPPETPIGVQHLLRRCLTKDPHQRLHDIADARIELDDTDVQLGGEATLAAERAARATSRPRELVAWSLALAAAALSVWIYFASSEESRPSVGPVRFSLNPRGFVYGISHAKGISRGLYERAAVSPDGSRLAFVAVDENGATHIWVRSFTHSDSTRLEGTNGAGRVFWSPDGDRIAFRARGGLFAVPSAGGPVQRIAENLSGAGGSWGRQGVILLGAVDGVWRVDATGGELTRLFEREEFRFWPSFLPDGEHFLYLSEIERGTGHGADNLGIHVASIAEPSQRRLLLPVSSRALYSDGYLLYVNESALMAQPFDVDTLSLAGEGAVLADRLDYFESYGGSTVSAAAGRLIYVTRMPPKALRWVDRKGESRGSLGEPESYADVTSISPGGTHAVGAVRSPRLGTHDLLLFDLERGTSTRLTTEETWESYPVWSPDGRRIAYASDSSGPPDLFVLALDGGGTKKPLLATPEVQISVAWVPDGKEILFTNFADEGKLWSFPLTGDGDASPLSPSAPVVARGEAAFSPDGRWLGFSSMESDRNQIYVQPFRRQGARVRLSQNGGQRPRWRRDGRELFFQSGRSVLAVPMESGEDFVSGTPATLFTLEEPFAFQDVMPDGQRFLVLIEPSLSDFEPIQVMLDWPAFL